MPDPSELINQIREIIETLKSTLVGYGVDEKRYTLSFLDYSLLQEDQILETEEQLRTLDLPFADSVVIPQILSAIHEVDKNVALALAKLKCELEPSLSKEDFERFAREETKIADLDAFVRESFRTVFQHCRFYLDPAIAWEYKPVRFTVYFFGFELWKDRIEFQLHLTQARPNTTSKNGIRLSVDVHAQTIRIDDRSYSTGSEVSAIVLSHLVDTKKRLSQKELCKQCNVEIPNITEWRLRLHPDIQKIVETNSNGTSIRDEYLIPLAGN